MYSSSGKRRVALNVTRLHEKPIHRTHAGVGSGHFADGGSGELQPARRKGLEGLEEVGVGKCAGGGWRRQSS